jgi:predicted NUDIX family NTP pyrophosphohydrolase
LPRRSAGILLYRGGERGIEVLLVLPGGPFWKGRDRGAWQIPKGLIEPGEEPAEAARREAAEELGVVLPGALRPLGALRQAGGKWVEGFALEGDFEPEAIVSNRFEMEWPRGSGKLASFPEVERARWFALAEAAEWILPSQAPFLDRLAEAGLG